MSDQPTQVRVPDQPTQVRIDDQQATQVRKKPRPTAAAKGSTRAGSDSRARTGRVRDSRADINEEIGRASCRERV